MNSASWTFSPFHLQLFAHSTLLGPGQEDNDTGIYVSAFSSTIFRPDDTQLAMSLSVSSLYIPSGHELQVTLTDLTTADVLLHLENLEEAWYGEKPPFDLTVDPLHEYKLTFSGWIGASDGAHADMIGNVSFDEPIRSLVPDSTSTAGLLFLALSPLWLLRKLYLHSIRA
jgi:hypothetical protein